MQLAKSRAEEAAPPPWWAPPRCVRTSLLGNLHAALVVDREVAGRCIDGAVARPLAGSALVCAAAASDLQGAVGDHQAGPTRGGVGRRDTLVRAVLREAHEGDLYARTGRRVVVDDGAVAEVLVLGITRDPVAIA